jgi:fructose-1,6-bisphosphatase I
VIISRSHNTFCQNSTRCEISCFPADFFYKVQHARGKLTTLLNAFEVASKYVSSKVRAAGLFALYGAEGSTNVQGELVKKLDVVANDAFITALTRSRTVSLIVSEENEQPIVVPDGGDYVVAMDPLDGSSNIDVNISIGSIFAIYHRAQNVPEGTAATAAEILRPGLELVAAGYTMYGSATQLVLTIKVTCFA